MRRSAALACGLVASPADEGAVEELGRRIEKDDDRIVVHFATLSLGEIGGPAAFRLLRTHFGKANKEARQFFLVAFGLCKAPESAAILKRELLSSKDSRDQSAAALGLGLLEERANAPFIREQFGQAKDWLLLQTTMLSLGILDDKKAADPIKDVLITKRQPGVRTSAAIAYALLRQWSAIPVFVDLLRSAKSIVTLSTIAQVTGFLSTDKVVPPLVELYRDKHLQRQARAFALVAIGSLGDPEEIPILIRLAFGMNYMVRSDPVDEALTIL